MVDARLAHLGPIRRQGVVSWLSPVVEDLVDDLGDVLRPGVAWIVRERFRCFELRQGYTGMLEEDVYEARQVGDEVDEECDGGEQPEDDRDPHRRAHRGRERKQRFLS